MRKSFWYLSLAAASHGLLDAFTTGGYGIAFLWPFSEQRFFAPVQMIDVSPLSISRFFSSRGLDVLGSELAWVWAPLLALSLSALVLRGTVKMGQK
jgi:inner membrane protein